ncbi:MAG: alpha/beta hydrolase [Nitrospinota bacterium]|nr:alpha/beta hydrolase [Nitrospinota bacterium]
METILMIHGMWHGPWCFEKYIAYFQQRGYKCLAPVLRHHDVAPSAPPPPEAGTVGLQDYADDLEKIIRGLPEPPIILGHSMGALLAQILAARGLGKAIVALATAQPAGQYFSPWTQIKSFSEPMTTWGFWRKPFKPSFSKAVYSMLSNMPEEERERHYGRLVHESGRAFAQIAFWSFDSSRGSWVDETKITQPMLLIGAGQDRITPVSSVRKVAAKYAKVAEYHEFPEMAHIVLSEPGWEGVAGYVHDWLKRKGL